MDQQGEVLTAESMNALYRRLNEAYYPGVVVDELQDIEWARIPHFYNAFYVYQYATGFSSAVAIADAILEYLTEEEQGYYRRGKNAHTHAAPKAATAKEYAKATGLEALFGALYLMGQTQRLNELFKLGLEAL